MISLFRSYADSTGPLISMAQEILANAYAGARELSNAETVADNLISQYPGTDIAKRSLILLASLSQFDPFYNQVSSTALAELKKDVASTTDAGLIAALTMGSGNASSVTASSQNKQVAVGSDTASSVPLKFEIGNYPNPFNPTTVISYQLPKAGHVTLKVYDVLGREVETLIDGYENVGVHTVQFNGENLASGVYFYRITTPGFTQVKKMILEK